MILYSCFDRYFYSNPGWRWRGERLEHANAVGEQKRVLYQSDCMILMRWMNLIEANTIWQPNLYDWLRHNHTRLHWPALWSIWGWILFTIHDFWNVFFLLFLLFFRSSKYIPQSKKFLYLQTGYPVTDFKSYYTPSTIYKSITRSDLLYI